MSLSDNTEHAGSRRTEKSGRVPSIMERFSVRLASFAGAFAFVGGTAIACPFTVRDSEALADDLSGIETGLADAATVVASAALPAR